MFVNVKMNVASLTICRLARRFYAGELIAT
jgi:hypothetical protein